MSSVVVTGTGLFTAAGLGSKALEQALAQGVSLVRERPDGLCCSDVNLQRVAWPDHPEWRAVREYAGRGSQLVVTAVQQALASITPGASALESERCASVTVGSDDWTEQERFAAAVAAAPAPEGEARALFSQLDDHFLLRSFRWGLSYAVGAIAQAQGPSISIDAPAFGGLNGLRIALDLIESGEADAVMLVGVDTIPRLDVAACLERLARESGQGTLGFGQGAAALMLERSASAKARGAAAKAHIVDCEIQLDAQLDRTAACSSTEAVLGRLFSSAALVNLCLQTERLASADRSQAARGASVAATERFWALGHGVARLEAPAGVSA